MLKNGSDGLSNVYIGSTAIAKAYLGENLVYQLKPEVFEKPDCVRIDFSTTSDNYSFMFGRYIGLKVSYIELDGEQITWTSSPESRFTVPTAGQHTVYIKPSGEWASNRTFGYFQYCDYIRFPYNASTILLCNVSPNNSTNKWAKIDILDTAYWSRVKSNSYSVFANATKIRVPVGSKQLYQNNSVNATILGKMSEYNFTYEL